MNTDTDIAKIVEALLHGLHEDRREPELVPWVVTDEMGNTSLDEWLTHKLHQYKQVVREEERERIGKILRNAGLKDSALRITSLTNPELISSDKK